MATENHDSNGNGQQATFGHDALSVALASQQFLTALDHEIARAGGDSEEVLSRTLLVLWIIASTKRFRPEGTPMGLALGVARRVRKGLAREARRARRADLSDEIVGPGAQPIDAAIRSEDWTLVDAAMRHLSEVDLRSIRAGFLEPGETRGRPRTSTERARLSRALAKLRRRLQGW